VGDALRLTLMAPEIVEAVLGGTADDAMTLPVLMQVWRSSGKCSASP
jgi:hypothetical protein